MFEQAGSLEGDVEVSVLAQPRSVAVRMMFHCCCTLYRSTVVTDSCAVVMYFPLSRRTPCCMVKLFDVSEMFTHRLLYGGRSAS